MSKGNGITNIDESLLQTSQKLAKIFDESGDKNVPKDITGTIKFHSKLAVGSALIPIPGVDVAAGAANIISMYIRINKKLNIPFDKNVLKSIATGVATNLVTYITSGVASTLKFIPGIGSFTGAMIMSASLYAVTLTAGWVYINALCFIVENKGKSFIETDIANAVNTFLKNKEEIKHFIDVSKKYFKK